MQSGFDNPIVPRKHEPRVQPKDGKNSPWDFRCPEYDQRSSCFIQAGTNYGVGFNNPVGKESASGKSPIPFGRVNTMKIDET